MAPIKSTLHAAVFVPVMYIICVLPAMHDILHMLTYLDYSESTHFKLTVALAWTCIAYVRGIHLMKAYSTPGTYAVFFRYSASSATLRGSGCLFFSQLTTIGSSVCVEVMKSSLSLSKRAESGFVPPFFRTQKMLEMVDCCMEGCPCQHTSLMSLPKCSTKQQAV